MNLTPVELKNYHPLPYKITKAHLKFNLDPNRTIVDATLSVTPTGNEFLPLVLNGENLKLISVLVNGQSISPELKENTLVIPGFSKPVELQIQTAISPKNNTELDGLYWVNTTFCTQNEPEGFRKITYFLDRPDNLTVFTTTLVADEKLYPYLLSNGNLVDKSIQNGKITAVWHDPFPKPSYLYALVAGNFDITTDYFITMSGRTVLLEIYSEIGYGSRCLYAMEALKRAMSWDEIHYGREYDLDRFMIVAIDSFNMGAMENKGLNIFNSVYILADPKTATDTDYMNIEAVVAHEYFHNWTGNRITCRDWFQLTLKEGLTVYRDQEFSADTNSRAVKRLADIRLIMESQFTEDAGPMAHPIQPKSYLEINNFYTSTIYNKGAEVIRMMAHLAGPSGYRRGTDLYFDRFDGQAVTTEEFIRAIEDGASIDLSQFRRWYHQAGTPSVTISPTVTNGIITQFSIAQSCRPTPESSKKEPFLIPIACAFFDRSGEAIEWSLNGGPPALENLICVSNDIDTFDIGGLQTGAIPSLLRGFSAPITLHYPYATSDLLHLLQFDTDPVNRYWASQSLFEEQILRELDHSDPDGDPTTLIYAIRGLITNTTMDPSEVALCLQRPTLNHLLDKTTGFPIESLDSTRNTLILQIATQLESELVSRYRSLAIQKTYSPSPDQIGKRRLKNTLLLLLADSQIGQSLAIKQFESADNLTDQLAAFTAIFNSNCDDVTAQRYSELFYTQWQSEPLVINKWFAVQAGSKRPSTLNTVQSLLAHPSFDPLVPNQFRALVGGFASNTSFFHHADGTGYRWVIEQIKKLDPFNPQIAARVALAFQRTSRCNIDRRRLIDVELSSVLGNEPVSKNLFEVVSKIKGSYNLVE